MTFKSSNINREESLEYLFNENYTNLCFFVKKNIGNISDTEDIVQDVFLNIWTNKDKIPKNIPFKAFIYKSCKNKAIDFLRHKKIEREYESEILIKYAFDDKIDLNQVELNELNEKIDEAIKTLSPMTKVIFEYSRNEGLKYVEISEKLKISVKTVDRIYQKH